MEKKNRVNNQFYDDLGKLWHTGNHHPIALLRAENALRNPWIATLLPSHPVTILDIGCGGGLLSNLLAQKGHQVTGVDLSTKSLQIAQHADCTRSVCYIAAPAETLPFADHSFDVVCAMDLLEHVDDPTRVIAEASRVLKTGGRFFFHTFNRTWLSWLVVIKGVEWCVRDTPPYMHRYGYFLTPTEVTKMCSSHHMHVKNILGVVPEINKAFWKMILTREVTNDFKFRFTPSLKTGYSGYCIKD